MKNHTTADKKQARSFLRKFAGLKKAIMTHNVPGLIIFQVLLKEFSQVELALFRTLKVGEEIVDTYLGKRHIGEKHIWRLSKNRSVVLSQWNHWNYHSASLSLVDLKRI